MSEQDILKKQLEALKVARRGKSSASCVQIISVINEYFDQPKSANETKYAVELLLKDSDKKIDFLKFIISAIYIKDLHESAIKVFEVINKVISTNNTYVKPFSKNLTEISVECLKYTDPSARFKEMAVKTVTEIIDKDILDEEIDIGKVVTRLMAVLNQDVKNRLFSSIYELLGKISKKYPEKFPIEKAIEFRNKLITAIQNLFKDDKASISLMLVAGAVDGLKNHLHNFAPTEYEQDNVFKEKLYECMIQLSDPSKHPSLNTHSNRVAFRNMLQVVHLYGHLVSEFLFRDYIRWHRVLLLWLNSKLYEDKSVGLYATYTFHVEIAANLERRRNESDKQILLYFMNFFQKFLKAPQSEPHEIRIGIRGMGVMAHACKVLLDPKYLSERFDLVMQRTEYSYYVGDKMRRREVLEHLPSYVEALSKIMNQLNEISGIQLQSLQSILVILIKDFHFLSTSHHGLVAVGLLETLINVQKSGGKILDDILESVIWQGILWTCSHQLTYDIQENIDSIKDWKETITYQKYLPLWKRILTPQDQKYQLIGSKIYEHFIKNLFLIIDKLDLSTKKRKYRDESSESEVEFYFTDPSLDLEPVRTENFQILYNLVQFYQDIFSQQTTQELQMYFIDWIELWIEKSIQFSYKYAIISAFMYFIEIALTIMERVDYTKNATLEVSKFKTVETLKSFIRTLFPRCHQISGELQVACLQLIFKAPTSILVDININELINILIIGFTVGKSVLSLAHYALTCFESLIISFQAHPKTRRILLQKVLPCLETFLSTSKESSMESELKILKYRKQKSKVIIQNIETDLMRFKKRILLFLGNCSPDEAQLILSNFEQKLIKDYITDIFQIKLESNDQATPLIYLDQIIDRICHLSLYSSDRSTKVSACELLHGLVLYMMGKNLDRAESLPMWRSLCKTIIILGADKDQTVRQLFEPLLMQMMHYFSQPNKILSPFSTVLMESVMEMMSYKENGIQDLSARLLREYILWLMRQTDREQRKISPVRLVDFFCELRKMSVDTDQSKRLAATLGFNNIYRIVREEESLVDVYWIYLLDIFCTNFKNTEDFSEHLDIYFVDHRRFEQISATLDHLTRVFVEKSEIFQQINSSRIVPCGFNGMTLRDVLNWLFQQCAMSQYFYRHKCMEIFMKILSEYNTKEFYYNENCNVEKIVEIGDTITGIERYPDLKYLTETKEPIFKEIFQWLRILLSSLDFYQWILKNELIPQDGIKELVSKTIVINSVDYFLKNVAFNNMLSLLESIDDNLVNSTQASLEIRMNNRNFEKFDVMKNLILLTLLDFFKELMKQYSIDVILMNNKDEIIKLVKKLLFKPQRINFEYKLTSVVNNSRERVIDFIKASNQHAPTFSQSLLSALQNKVMKYLNEFCQSCEKILSSKNLDEEVENKLKGINFIINNLYSDIASNELSYALVYKSAEVLLKKLFDGIVDSSNYVKRPRQLTPSVKKFASNVLRLCLKIDPFLLKISTYSFDNEELKVSDSCKIFRGEHFLQVFKSPIFEAFTLMLQDTVELLVAQLNDATDNTRLRIFNILAELNEYIYKNHNQNVNLLEENFQTIISSWPKIMQTFSKMNNNLNSVDLTIINLVTYIAMTCPYELITLGQRLENFRKWLLELFQIKTNSFEIKSKAIFLLPCITNSEDKVNEELLKSLTTIQQTHIPLRSTEFSEGSLERSSLVAFTNSIFQALLTSKSPVIYRFLVNMTVIDEQHILEEKLQKTQIQLMRSLSENEQEIFLVQTFESFTNQSFDADIRLSLVKRYLLTILKNSSSNTILSFIKQKISQIFQLMDSRFDIEPEIAFVNRSAGYMLIEAFAASVPREMIESATYSYGGNVHSGLIFIKEIIMKAKDVRRDVVFMVDDKELQELFRKFQCYCYRALATIVANTKDLPEVFNLCIFQENPRTGSFIWRKLIDIRDESIYSNWSQDFDEFPKVKQYITSIKDIEVTNLTNEAQRKYINTISIFDKSLSQTLTKTDLSYSVVLSNREILEKNQKEQQKNMQVNLESIPINDHEIMGTLIGIINLMYNKKLTVFSDFQKADKKKYEWVISIVNSLKNPDQHKNVKIFLLKLIENCRNIFVYYAEFLLNPILTILTEGLFDTMNFFVTDLITMLLSWSHVYKPTQSDEKEDAGLLLKFLMNNAYHERSEVFKLNLELIKKLIETWNEILVGKIPTQILLDMLQKPQEENQNFKLICGIQINAVVLANNLTPWSNGAHCELFIKSILMAFNNGSPKVYQAASQLMGLCLSMMSKNNESGLTTHLALINKLLEKLNLRREKSEIFLQILYGIQKEYPSILDPFMCRIASAIPSAIRKIKCIYLEMFLARLETFKDSAYKEIASIKIKYLLKQNEYQLLALHIINKGIELMSAQEFMMFFDDLSYLISSRNGDVKKILYEIMIYSIQKYANAEGFDKKKPLKIILKGFNDPDMDIQKRVAHYFNENSGLSKSFRDRFQQLLSNYYDPQLEKEFLHYATQLLLEIPIHHPRSNRALLDYDPRNNTNFFEYPIITRTNTQRSLPPMFIQSQQKQLLAGDGSQYNNLIRATQLSSSEYQIFAPTQDPNTMTQFSQSFNFKQTQNSLFVSLKPQYLNQRSQVTSQQSPVLEDIQMQIQRNKEKNSSDSLDYLRQRIVKKSSDETSRHYAMRAIERRDFGEAHRNERINKFKQGKEVVLYRRYRLGDFPDFFFNSLAILMPLQALVKKDDIIARHVYISIFESVVNTFIKDRDDDAKSELYATINNAIVFALKNTIDCNPMFLGTLIELAIMSERYLEISPDIIGNSLAITGIIFIESQLLRLKDQKKSIESTDVQPAKRVKIDEDEVQLNHWMKLIELYYKINEYEVVNGIFIEKLKLDSLVKIKLLKTLDLELNNQYKDASDNYAQLIHQNAYRNTNEKDFYYNSYFNCLAHLSDWEQVTHSVQSQLSSYEEIWNGVTFHQNTLLPMLLKGELLKMLNGDVNEGFLAILEDWFDDDKKNEYLRRKFPEEIGMLNVIEENYAACCVDMDKILHNISEEWATLEMQNDKAQLLKACRNISEITNFVSLMSASDPELNFRNIENLLLNWDTSYPKSTDSFILWNDLVAYRKTFLHLLISKYPIDDKTRITSEGSLIDTERKLLDVAFEQKNLDAAKFLVSRLKNELKDSSNENILKFNLVVSKYTVMNAELKYSLNNIQLMRKLGNAWDKFKVGILTTDRVKNHPEFEIEALCGASDISWKIFKLYQKVDEDLLTDDINSGFMSLMNVTNTESNVMEELLRYGENALKTARNLAQKCIEQEQYCSDENMLGKTYLKMCQFYRNVYVDGINNTQEIQHQMMISIFRAISNGSNEAKVYLPYILQLPAIRNNSLTNDFNEQLNIVPTWMFLGCISQILSNFNFENECYLDVLLMKLAKEYPNALYFPFNLSRENFHYVHENQIMEKSLVKEIEQILSSKTIDQFTSALQCLVVPEKFLDVHFSNFYQKCIQIDTNQKYQESIDKLLDNIFHKNLNLKGPDFRKTFKNYYDRIKQLKTFNWENERINATNHIQNIQKDVVSGVKKHPKSTELRKLCPWLAEYKWSGEADFLEIPGQYTGTSKPFIEGHIKIVRFEQQVKIFNSKQLPVEIKILGSDGKYYNFIIKYGEDLRQDQRIQQALKLMSEKLALDRNCVQNQLKIDTYEVVPINSVCGILQIINNATTIFDFMQDISKQFMVQEFADFITTIRQKYHSFLIGNNQMFKEWVKLYENAVININREDLINKFMECEKMIPNDILQKSLQKISITLEAYYILRKNFMTSLAAMSIGHWLLGIGDRHLSNILIDMKNGRLIGIDFGIAFGTAVTLGVPELIPFRLTSHFVNVLEPMSINGLIKKNMMHTLNCFRNNKEAILLFLEVFINEPTLDWLLSSKLKRGNNNDTTAWNPEKRIDIVRRKIDGLNPVNILIEELGFRNLKEPVLQAYQSMINGNENSIRKTLSNRRNDEFLTVEDQISCLIEIATDKSILATTYLGWDAWF